MHSFCFIFSWGGGGGGGDVKITGTPLSKLGKDRRPGGE